MDIVLPEQLLAEPRISIANITITEPVVLTPQISNTTEPVVITTEEYELEIVVKPSGGKVDVILGDFVAGESITSGQIVTIGYDSKLYLASADNIAHAGKPLGTTISSPLIGQKATLIVPTYLEGSYYFTPSDTIYLGLNGQITNNNNIGLFQQELGIALSNNKIRFDIGLCIVR